MLHYTHDFRHAADQQPFYQHTDDDANATNKQSVKPPNTDPSLLREQIDSYLTETAPILDAALHDFRHAADQQHLYQHTNDHKIDLTAPQKQSYHHA